MVNFAQLPEDDEDMNELSGEEIAEHFLEVTVNDTERLFQSSITAPYPFPVDTPEQKRISKEHELLKRMFGANFVGPVLQVLPPGPPGSRVVVDIGTGPGQWVLEMAEQFPYAVFHGLDIVPIAPRVDLPDNANFEVHDINEKTRFLTGSIDLVHARSVSMAVTDYRTIINEAARILRSGGLFIYGEWCRYPTFDTARFPNSTPRGNAPEFTRFFEIWNEALVRRKGIRTVEHEIMQLVRASGCFREVTSHSAFLPIGDWREEVPLKMIGRQYRDCMKRYLESSRRLLLDGGHTNAELDVLFANVFHEMRYVEGMGGLYYIVTAVRHS